ncbi:MAG: HAD-IA family hydrolase [Myxococcota bacterium]
MADQKYRGAVLFDAAGTLIELSEPVGETYARVARGFGVDQNADRLDSAFRQAFAQAPPMAFPSADPAELPTLERAWWRRCVQETFARCETDASETGNRFSTQQSFDRFFEVLFATMGGASTWRVAEGALELLRQLRSLRFGIAIVSNFDFRLPALLDDLGIAALVDVVVLASDVGAAKPDPALFERAMAQLRVSPDNTLVVGDHQEQDIAAARYAGLRAVDVGSLATLGELMKIIEAFELR